MVLLRQRYRVSSYFLQKWAIILLHQSQLGTNRAVGTSRSRNRGYRRHRRHRYDVREELCSHQKGADEAKRNWRWCRRLLPTKEKPLSYVGWAQDKGFIWKGGLGGIPLQCKIYFLFNLATLYTLRIIASIAIFLINTRYYSKKAQTLLLKWCTLCNHNKAI